MKSAPKVALMSMSLRRAEEAIAPAMAEAGGEGS